MKQLLPFLLLVIPLKAITLNIDSNGQAAGNTYDYSGLFDDFVVTVTSDNNDGAVFIGNLFFDNVFDLNNGEVDSAKIENFQLPSPNGSLRNLIANNCTFSGSLNQVDLRDATFNDSNFDGTALTGSLGATGARTADFNNTTLDGTTLSGDLSNWTFDGVTLLGADLSGVSGTIGTVTNSVADASTNFGSNTALADQFVSLEPEIVVEPPTGNPLATGGTVDLPHAALGDSSSVTITIRNTGIQDLDSFVVTRSGTHEAEFVVTTPPTGPVTTGATTSLTIEFSPAATGTRSAALQVASNAVNDNPFIINLTGTGFDFDTDGDGDGLSDGSEVQLAALGFDPGVSQPDMVNTYYAAAGGAGLFTAQQIQALNPQTPSIQKDPATGKVTLVMDWQRSTDLTQFNDFPASPGEVSVNGSGDIEFEFTPTGDAAFFLIEID